MWNQIKRIFSNLALFIVDAILLIGCIANGFIQLAARVVTLVCYVVVALAYKLGMFDDEVIASENEMFDLINERLHRIKTKKKNK